MKVCLEVCSKHGVARRPVIFGATKQSAEFGLAAFAPSLRRWEYSPLKLFLFVLLARRLLQLFAFRLKLRNDFILRRVSGAVHWIGPGIGLTTKPGWLRFGHWWLGIVCHLRFGIWSFIGYSELDISHFSLSRLLPHLQQWQTPGRLNALKQSHFRWDCQMPAGCHTGV